MLGSAARGRHWWRLTARNGGCSHVLFLGMSSSGICEQKMLKCEEQPVHFVAFVLDMHFSPPLWIMGGSACTLPPALCTEPLPYKMWMQTVPKDTSFYVIRLCRGEGLT